MFAFVLDLHSSVLSQEIGWEERVRNDLLQLSWIWSLDWLLTCGTWHILVLLGTDCHLYRNWKPLRFY